MNALNVSLRIFFAALIGAIGLLFLWLSTMTASAILGGRAMPGDWKGAVIEALVAAPALWRAYANARAAWRVKTGAQPATSTPALAALAVLILASGWFVYSRVFAFRPGEGFLRGTKDMHTRGNLGSIRSALSIYYGDMEGQYPARLEAIVDRRWLETLPRAETDMHPPSAAVRPVSGQEHASGARGDTGGWFYVTDGANGGSVGVDCTHTDAKGSSWNAY